MPETPPTSPYSADGSPLPGVARLRWDIGNGRRIDTPGPVLMAVLNMTPDSFSDGGDLATPAQALARATEAAEQGADIIDIGGESTRPGAQRVSDDEQIARTVPAVRAIREAGLRIPVSIDTTRAPVARAALDAGADIVNDVSAGLDDPDLLPLIAERGAAAVLMHRDRPPEDDVYSDEYAAAPRYTGGVVRAVHRALSEAVDRAVAAGVPEQRVVVDPGLGFGKSVAQNMELIASCRSFAGLCAGMLVGASRKSFVGALSFVPDPAERACGSVGAAVAARLAGAHILRVHDVREHYEALRIVHGVQHPDLIFEPH